jgi:murein DD-endopeptidase MepM/ murein hydrolase activator NlpD
LSPRVTRVLIGAVVAGVAAAALRLPLTGFNRVDPLAALDANLGKWTVFDTLGNGETLSELLTRRGFAGAQANAMIRAATPLDPRRIPAGMAVEMLGDTSDARPYEIRFQMAVDRIVKLERKGEEWLASEVNLPWKIDTVLVRGVVKSSLYEAVATGAAKLLPYRATEELAWNIADIYEYRFDMSRDLREGDEIRALFERMTAPNGTVRIGAVLAAGLQRAGTEVQAFRLVRENGRSRYYDQQGRSLASTFLRAPLSFRRISSNFGRRRHPVLGTWRAHQGMDYAANSGTPVRSIGDGVVLFVGSRGGYGNLVEVRHPNGFITRYGHLRGFARDLRRGMRVEISQTIGYVGMTGLATGPHLHFEVLVNGRHRDPRSALQTGSGPTLSGADRALFERIRAAAAFALEQPSGIVRALGN